VPPSPKIHQDSDQELLSAFVASRRDEAFAALVERHLPVVWSCAWRVTHGDRALAQDVIQQVFADLASKAQALPAGMPLGGWLHRHTFFTATKAVRKEIRRRTHESQAALHHTMTDPPCLQPANDTEALWAQLSDHLDAELAALSADDRDALVLRYFQKRSHRAIARDLLITEEAARKRIDRALEKLRRRLNTRGVSMASGTALAALLPQAVMAPPNGLAAAAASLALVPATATVAGSPAGVIAKLLSRPAKRITSSLTVPVATGLTLVVASWMWWAHRNPASNAESAAASGTSPKPRAITTNGSKAGEFLPPLRATAFLVPDSLVAGRLMADDDPLDEAALYALAVQTAQQGGGQTIEVAPVAPPVVEPGNSDQYAQSQTTKEFRYPVEFDFASDGTPIPVKFATKPVGTMFKVYGWPAAPDGTHAVSFSLEHHLAPPGETRWSANLADPAADHVSVVSQPRFHVVELNGRVSMRPGETRLGGSTLVPGWLNPRKPGTAERLLVFLTLEPPSSR